MWLDFLPVCPRVRVPIPADPRRPLERCYVCVWEQGRCCARASEGAFRHFTTFSHPWRLSRSITLTKSLLKLTIVNNPWMIIIAEHWLFGIYIHFSAVCELWLVWVTVLFGSFVASCSLVAECGSARVTLTYCTQLHKLKVLVCNYGFVVI